MGNLIILDKNDEMAEYIYDMFQKCFTPLAKTDSNNTGLRYVLTFLKIYEDVIYEIY